MDSNMIHNQRLKRWWRNTVINSRCPFVLMIPVNSDMIVMWDRWYWKSYLLSFMFLCIRGTSKTEFVCSLDDDFSMGCPWTRQCTRIQDFVGFYISLDSLTGLFFPSCLSPNTSWSSPLYFIFFLNVRIHTCHANITMPLRFDAVAVNTFY
jgi:hypothetical protein